MRDFQAGLFSAAMTAFLVEMYVYGELNCRCSLTRRHPQVEASAARLHRVH